MPSNNINIKSVAVIGAGVMGAQLAALFANKGINLILKTKYKIDAVPMNAKQLKAIKDDGT